MREGVQESRGAAFEHDNYTDKMSEQDQDDEFRSIPGEGDGGRQGGRCGHWCRAWIHFFAAHGWRLGSLNEI
jgi:hypothetical protein